MDHPSMNDAPSTLPLPAPYRAFQQCAPELEGYFVCASHVAHSLLSLSLLLCQPRIALFDTVLSAETLSYLPAPTVFISSHLQRHLISPPVVVAFVSPHSPDPVLPYEPFR